MLSSVSYVCLGMCAGLWVISGGINLGLLVLSFISILLFQRSGHFCLFLTFYYMCVCMFSAFILQMFSALLCGRIFGLRFSRYLGNPCKFSSGCCVGQQSTQYFPHYSSYNRCRSQAREHGFAVFPASPFHFPIYKRHLMTEDSISPGVSSSQHRLVSPVGQRAVSF